MHGLRRRELRVTLTETGRGVSFFASSFETRDVSLLQGKVATFNIWSGERTIFFQSHSCGGNDWKILRWALYSIVGRLLNSYIKLYMPADG